MISVIKTIFGKQTALLLRFIACRLTKLSDSINNLKPRTALTR